MYVAANTLIQYDRIEERPVTSPRAGKVHRWIGRCKACGGTTHRIEGELLSAHAPEQRYAQGPRAGSTRAAHWDYIVRATDGQIYTMDSNGTDMVKLPIRCSGTHWCRLQRVYEGRKQSKHECGARCRNATGPSCDCKCRGQHHGSNC